MTASGKNSDQVFQLMKDTIKWIADEYQSQNIQYSLLVFGEEAHTQVSFKERVNVTALKESVDGLVKPRGESSLEKGLEEGRKEFRRSGVRVDAAKVLVVLTDKSQGVEEKQVLAAAEGLKRIGVKVIPVAVGDEADAAGLGTITSKKENVVEGDIDEDPKKLGHDIMKAVLAGKIQSYRQRVALPWKVVQGIWRV